MLWIGFVFPSRWELSLGLSRAHGGMWHYPELIVAMGNKYLLLKSSRVPSPARAAFQKSASGQNRTWGIAHSLWSQWDLFHDCSEFGIRPWLGICFSLPWLVRPCAQQFVAEFCRHIKKRCVRHWAFSRWCKKPWARWLPFFSYVKLGESFPPGKSTHADCFLHQISLSPKITRSDSKLKFCHGVTSRVKQSCPCVGEGYGLVVCAQVCPIGILLFTQ